jgi:hypothetical protein
LKVWVACAGDVCEVWETTVEVGVDVVVGTLTETLLALLIPRMLSAVIILKQPT